uniref:DNA topoisomerase n=1 Tax=Globodera pallida TaxID=36090 RepID=A0A183BNJ9_GLOPA
MNVLMVAEKPIAAEAIAKILSDEKCIEKGRNGHSVFEYTANFRGKPANFRVTSTFGHMMCLDFTKPYQPRFKRRVNPFELFLCPIERKEDTDMNMCRFLASEAKNCDILVLWLDCDMEGENICFEVMDAVRQAMNGPSGGVGFMENVYRARFSAITDKEIKNAMESLGKPNYNVSLAVEARQELDLRIGCAFTRFQNEYFKEVIRDVLAATGGGKALTVSALIEMSKSKPEPELDGLQDMFPNIRREVIRDVLKANRGDRDSAGSALLEMTN